MISVRTLRQEDAVLLAEIERDSFPHPDWTPDEFLRYDCLVAEVDGVVAGFLVSRLVFIDTPEHEILNLAVTPVYRRLGVAKALLKTQIERGGSHYLEVRESNLAARQLYEAVGFSEIGRRPNYYSMPCETAIVMKMK